MYKILFFKNFSSIIFTISNYLLMILVFRKDDNLLEIDFEDKSNKRN